MLENQVKDEAYYNSLDKRTLEYKEYKKNFDKANTTGLGDVVEKVTKATGIKKAVKIFVDGKDCGCDKRKEKLNKIKLKFNAVRCLTEDQYKGWTEFINKEKKNEVTYLEQVHLIIPIYAHLFARQLKPMSCCVEPYVKEIQKVYEAYQ